MEMDKKITALKNSNENTFALAMKMMDECNSQYNKGIRTIDVMIGMGEIIDFLLKNK
jgi:hypothetical protein